MLCECNKKAVEARSKVLARNNETNIKFLGYFGLKIHNIIQLRSIKEAVWIIDTVKFEDEYMKMKYKTKYDLFDIEARNIFSNRSIIMAIIKCTYRYNPYGIRCLLINTQIIGNE